MEIEVVRDTLTDKSSVGSIYVDGLWHCHSLEDRVRSGPKVQGQTAIPCGRYEVVIDYSNRFKRLMPHILEVPGFTGIRIHKGNTDKDVEGCIAVGAIRGRDWVGSCSEVYGSLLEKISLALKTENVYITVRIEEGAVDARSYA
jgi:hypothetical protein